MNITTIGVDLAKTSFSLVGTNKHGKVVLRKTLSRNKLMSFITQCPPCLIGLQPKILSRIYSATARSVGSERRIAPIRRIGTPHRAALL
jgi:transposase